MKKIALSFLLAFAMVPSLQAQFFLIDQNDSDREEIDPEQSIIVPIHNVEYDQYLPLGPGLLTLSGLGIGYLLVKNRKKDK